MKKLIFLAAAALMCLGGHGKTLEEVRSEYPEGVYVYSSRYEGSGATRIRFDTVKLPNGKITVKIVEDPEVKSSKKVNRVDENKPEPVYIFATTNKHGIITRAYTKKSTQEIEIETTTVKREEKKSETNQVSKVNKLLKAETPEVPEKHIYDYKATDIKSYSDQALDDDSITNKLIKFDTRAYPGRRKMVALRSKLAAAKASKNGTPLLKTDVEIDATTYTTNNTTVISDNYTKPRYNSDLAYDGGYYYMSDGFIISYRAALNWGFVRDEPINDLQMTVFIEVTSDPDSFWTRRTIFETNPNSVKKSTSVKSKDRKIYRH